MKTEKEIKKIIQKYKDEYVRYMNGAGNFTPKHKYSLQGKIDALEEILNEDKNVWNLRKQHQSKNLSL